MTVSVGISVSELGQRRRRRAAAQCRCGDVCREEPRRARSVVFQPDMHLRALQRLDLEGELRRAIERDEFRLHYQPLVEVEHRANRRASRRLCAGHTPSAA